MKHRLPISSNDDEIKLSYSDDEDIPFFSVPYQLEAGDDRASDDENLAEPYNEYRRQRMQKTEKRVDEILSITRNCANLLSK